MTRTGASRRSCPATAPPQRAAASRPARAGGLLALLDYDGTVTTRECNEIVFQRLTGDAWRVFEDAARRGEIGHAECFDRQLGLVTASREEVFAAVVAVAEPAPGLGEFLAGLVAAGGRAAIVSAGYREAIEAFWAREHLPAVGIHAERGRRRERRRPAPVAHGLQRGLRRLPGLRPRRAARAGPSTG